MNKKQTKAQAEELTDEELLEMDELLASVDEKFESMDAAEADGFMTALELMSIEPEEQEWIEEILAPGAKGGTTGELAKDRRLRKLIERRKKEISKTLKESEPLDPIYFDVEDEEGNVLEGKKAIAALEPFALGFLEAAQKWPGLLESDSDQIASALHGILRHLPKYALGDFAPIKEELDKNVPLEDLPAALSDLACCIASIAQVTKGYKLPSLNEPLSDEEEREKA